MPGVALGKVYMRTGFNIVLIIPESSFMSSIKNFKLRRDENRKRVGHFLSNRATILIRAHEIAFEMND